MYNLQNYWYHPTRRDTMTDKSLIIAGSVVVFRSPCKLQLKPFYFQSGHTAYILTNWYLIIAGSISIDNYFSIFLYSLIIPTPLTPSPPKKNIPSSPTHAHFLFNVDIQLILTEWFLMIAWSISIGHLFSHKSSKE